MATLTRWRWLVLSVLFVGLVVLYYQASVHVFSGNSDGATVILEGQAIATGNPLLHGWSLSLDSFWSVDASIYALAVSLVGLRPLLLHAVPALLAGLVVVLGMAMARGRNAGYKRIAGPMAVVALLGLPSADLGYFFLQGPWHVGTVAYCLLAFVALSDERFGGRWALGVLVLAAGLLGDFVTLTIGIVPVVLAGVVTIVGERKLRAGASLISAGIASCLFAAGIRECTQLIGTFDLAKRNLPVHSAQVVLNLHHLARYFTGMFGVGSIPVGVRNGPIGLQAVRFIGVLIVGAGLISALLRFGSGLAGDRSRRVAPTGRDHLNDLLLIGWLADIVTFVVIAPTGNGNYARYLIPAVVFGAILGGRFVSHVVLAIDDWRVLSGVIALGAVFIVGSGLDMGRYLIRPTVAQPTARLATFLRTHKLNNGIGDYWSSSIVTVGTRGAVTVRPVTTDATGKYRRYDRQSSSSWYSGKSFGFLVYDSAHPWKGVNTTTATAEYGVPRKTYAVGSYRVLVWAHAVSVSMAVPAASHPLQLFFQ